VGARRLAELEQVHRSAAGAGLLRERGESLSSSLPVFQNDSKFASNDAAYVKSQR